MENTKKLNIAISLIAIIGVILFIRIFSVDNVEDFKTDANLQNSIVSPIIYFSTYLFLAAVFVAIGLSLSALIKNKENLKKTLISLCVLAVVLLFVYLFSDSSAVLDTQGKVLEAADTSTNKWVGTGISYSIVLGIVASSFFVIDLIKGLIKS